MDINVVSGSERGLSHLLREGHVDFPLCSRGRKLLLILVVGIPVALLAFKVSQIAVAARLGSQMNIEDLRRAIALDPGNAAYYYKLGLVYSYSLDQASLRKAIKFLRKATELNPRKALYWSDLAAACDSMNDVGIYFTPPTPTGCGLIKVANGAGSTCTAC